MRWSQMHKHHPDPTLAPSLIRDQTFKVKSTAAPTLLQLAIRHAVVVVGGGGVISAHDFLVSLEVLIEAAQGPGLVAGFQKKTRIELLDMCSKRHGALTSSSQDSSELSGSRHSLFTGPDARV